jgi:hypothetical protein
MPKLVYRVTQCRCSFVFACASCVLLVSLAVAGITADTRWAFRNGEQGSTPSAGTGGVVLGRVVDASSGEGIPDAMVATPARPGDLCLTDGQGRFVYFDLPAGSLVFTARKDGYAPGRSGSLMSGRADFALGAQPLDDSQPIELSDGDRVSNIVVPLSRYAAISGQVKDENGDPVVATTVEAWPRVIVGGRAWFNSTNPFVGTTDDRGVYRLEQVLAGDYVVVVPSRSLTVPATASLPAPANAPWRSALLSALLRLDPGFSAMAVDGPVRFDGDGTWRDLGSRPRAVSEQGRADAYPTMFAEASRTMAGASIMSVQSGSEVANVDVTISPVAAHRVSGAITGSDGTPLSAAIHLDSGDASVGLAVSDNSGRFHFMSIPEGDYRLRVTQFPPGAPRIRHGL